MMLFKALFITATVSVLGFLSACSDDAPVLLRVGTNQWPGYELLHLAERKGYYENAPIRMVEFPNATTVMHAFSQGSLEVAALTLDEVLSLQNDGVPLKIVAALDASNGADGLIAQNGISTLSELKGKRIGYENSAVGSLMLNAFLNAAGFKPRDIHLINLPVDEHVDAFIANKVDAVITFEPSISRLKKEGAQLLFDSAQIPGQILDVLIVQPNVLLRQQNTLKKLIDGHFFGLDLLKNQTENATKLMAPRLDITAPELKNAFKGLKLFTIKENRDLFSTKPDNLLNRAVALQSIMQSAKLIEQQASDLTLLFPPPQTSLKLFAQKGEAQ